MIGKTVIRARRRLKSWNVERSRQSLCLQPPVENFNDVEEYLRGILLRGNWYVKLLRLLLSAKEFVVWDLSLDIVKRKKIESEHEIVYDSTRSKKED